MFDLRARELLEKAIKLGDVYIVTAGSKGWVEHSAYHLLPSVSELLTTNNNIKVYSARSNFERDSKDPEFWKALQFNSIVADYKASSKKRKLNIVSIGDSVFERKASWRLITKTDDTHSLLFDEIISGHANKRLLTLRPDDSDSIHLIKTIKLIDRPSIDTMYDQFTEIHKQLPSVVDNPIGIDIDI